jgi:uncharacterized BrkB/YihY/UPF0761 family membrane protein
LIRPIELEARPRPLMEAAGVVSRITATVATVVTMLVGWGVVSLAQQDAIEGLLGAIPGLVTLISTILAAFGVARRAEPQVTPVSDPRDDLGTPLVPAA